MSVLSHIRFFATSWTVARQASLSMKLSRQEYWNRLPFPTPEDLSSLGSNPCLFCLLHWQVDSLPLHHLENMCIYTHTHTYTYSNRLYSAIKINEILPFETAWIDLDSIMLNEISQTEKDKFYCLLPHLCRI